MNHSEQNFEELIIPRKDLQDIAVSRYKVYKDVKDYILVEASSALDALKKSGINSVYKVQRYDPMDENVIHMSQVLVYIDHSSSQANEENPAQ